MWSKTTKLLLAICFYPFALKPAPCAAPKAKEFAGALLLHNGEVLSGTVTRRGDRYVVQLQDSGQLRIPMAEVQFIGRDLKHVFRYRSSRIAPSQVDRFIDLSQWCLTNDLLREGAECLLRAMEIDPDHPDLDRMEARLRQAARQGHTRPVFSPRASTVRNLDPRTAPVALPSGVVGEFTKSVQPLLLNSCTIAACHRKSNVESFGLFRPRRGRPMTRRQTMENLRATLPWINHETPEQSRLLTAARTPHGGSRDKAPNVPLQGEQFDSLRAWVNLVRKRSNTEATPSPPSKNAKRPSTLQSTDVSSQDAVEPISKDTSSDPFDPEIFNRRFLNTENTAGEEGRTNDE